MERNEAQEAVIASKEGHMLVVACPGSGKTTTMIRKIARLELDGVKGEHILVMTFTRDAALGMKKKYCSLCGKETNVQFCTIHSFCKSVLDTYGTEKKEIFKNPWEVMLQEMNHYPSVSDPEDFLKDFFLDVTRMKNSMSDLSDYIPQCTSKKELWLSLYRAYEQHKAENNLIDFDDMLLDAYRLLKENADALARIKSQFTYIMVDEYQDTNELQKQILYLIEGKNLFAVGDDDQSIYRFRGAQPSIMLDFQSDFPDAQIIDMSTNYRSCQSVISHADRLIGHNNQRYPKSFIGFRELPGTTEAFYYHDRESELGTIARQVSDLIHSGESDNEIAVLYRTNTQADGIAAAFLKAKIPFYCNDRIKNRYESFLFHDILAYYRLACKTGTAKDMRLIRNKPNRYLSKEVFGRCEPELSSFADAAKKHTWKSCWQKTKAMETVEDLFFHLNSLSKRKDPGEFLRYLYSSVGYRSYLTKYAALRNMDPGEFTDVYDSFLKDIRDNHIESFEAWLLYTKEYSKQLASIRKNHNGVTLSTMHRSKGLEWKHVFLADCVDGITPYKHKEDPVDMEEERRLFYVAMTRAKDHLVLSYYGNDGKHACMASPFLKEAEVI